MIRINLLGLSKPKKRAVPSLPTLEGGGQGMWLLVLLAVLVAAAAGNGFYYLKLKSDSDRIMRDTAAAASDYARLVQVRAKYEEREKQKDLYKRRVEVIDQLRASQSGPVNLLSMLGETVNHTDEVWLNTMDDDGSNINLKGMALNIHAVADLMRNLQTTGYFRQVDIKTASQDDKVKDMQAFFFELTCQKQVTSGAAAAGTKPAAPQPKS